MKNLFKLLKSPKRSGAETDVYADFLSYASKTDKIGYLQRLIMNSESEINQNETLTRKGRLSLERKVSAAKKELTRLYSRGC